MRALRRPQDCVRNQAPEPLLALQGLYFDLHFDLPNLDLTPAPLRSSEAPLQKVVTQLEKTDFPSALRTS